ncbi:UPF0223 family protein [Alkalibacillus silvisoli]|uniref:UPF0223 protein GCM10008935_04450 n=1 Tax=Alkalibacillus silvisoli TaxID=392823 RepID=A0ABN0ZMJ5_9BACI
MNYHYPIDPDWTTEEVMDVVQFFNTIEQAYEDHVVKEQILDHYKKFKQVIPAKSDEKSMFKDFEKQSGYIPYQVVKRAQEADINAKVSMK